MSLTAVSLFAGVGGFDLAMQRAGIDVVATVEIDKNARGVLQHRFPQARHFEDVTNVTSEQLRDAGFVPRTGIITGGFPCQDLSIAGKRAGLAGGRSGLYWQIIRLVDELQPKYLVLENVPGLLSSNGGRDFGTVLGALVERGYGVGYAILDAQHFGVPQRRRRVFIVGCLGDDGRTPGEILALSESLSGDSEEGAAAGEESPNDVGECADISRPLGTKRRHDLDNETYIARTLTARHDSSPDGDRGFNIVPVLLTMREGKDGGGKGPLVSEDQSLTLATGNGQVLIQPSLMRAVAHGEYVESSEAATLLQRDYKGGTADAVVQPYVKVIRSGARDEDGNLPPEVWAQRDVAPTLNAMDNTGDSRATVLLFDDRRRDAPAIRGQISSTLQAHMGTGGNNVPNVASRPAVRRLTPTECERLQGFPDRWTESRLDGEKVVKQADSARYKQLGNAVAVPGVEWIMNRLVSSEKEMA